MVGLRAGVPAARLRAIERRLGVRWAHVLGGRLGLVKAVRRLDASRGIGFTLVLGVKRGSVMWAVRSLRSYRRWVRFAEPDYLMRASAANVPNDPSFGLQWRSLNTGQSVNGVTGTAGADDKAAQAWSVSTGSRSIVIGEVDTGVDLTHPDLQANIWTNPGGIGGCAAGTHGYNVLTGSCSPVDDDNAYGGHGSHVAGIMGAVGNNGTGVAGMNWQTTILPVKWLDSNAWGSDSSLVSALDWVMTAKQAGVNVQVINDSATFEGDTGSQALLDAITQLGADGILFVTGAGNTGENDDNLATARYPCDYDLPNELCVTATNQNDQLPSWANYGLLHVDLGAPGDNIYSTLKSNNYGYISGGSMASAEVSGAAALILSVQQMSTIALKADILSSVDQLPALSGMVRSGGRLDVCKAMPGCAGPPPPPPPVPVNSGLPVLSGSAQVGQTLSVSNGSWSNSPTSYSYGWDQCNSSGGGCSAIANQSGSSYVVQSGDVGFTLRGVVTASNAGGPSQPASSVQSAVVSSAPATVNFGLTSVGSSSDSFSANRKRVNAYSISSGGSLTSLTMYLAPAGGSGTADLKGVVYADSGGKPGALLGATSQLAFSSSGSAGWYQMGFSSPVSLTAGKYWIGVITGGTSGVAGFRYSSVSGSRDYNSNTYSSGPTNPFGSFTTDSEQMSLYGTYSTGPPPPPPPVPVNSGLPVLSGSAQVGQTLSVSNGSWSNSPTSYSYGWDQCNSSGGGCSAIANQSGSSYVVQSGDVGFTLRGVVTASNAGGPSQPASSVQSAVVSSAPATVNFGLTSVGSSSDSFSANRKRVNAYSISSGGSLTSLSVYLAPAGGSGTADLKGVVYADSGGQPGALLGATSQLAFSSSGSAGWYQMGFSSPVSLTAGKYWIGVITGGTSGVAGFRYSSVSGSRDYNSNTYSSGPTNPFGSFTTDSEQMSLYGTYSTG